MIHSIYQKYKIIKTIIFKRAEYPHVQNRSMRFHTTSVIAILSLTLVLAPTLFDPPSSNICFWNYQELCQLLTKVKDEHQETPGAALCSLHVACARARIQAKVRLEILIETAEGETGSTEQKAKANGKTGKLAIVSSLRALWARPKIANTPRERYEILQGCARSTHDVILFALAYNTELLSSRFSFVLRRLNVENPWHK